MGHGSVQRPVHSLGPWVELPGVQAPSTKTLGLRRLHVNTGTDSS